jgi:CheY-like chemotaxis protein
VVSNLLANAAKFSAPDERIEIDLRRVGGQVQLTVTDEGIGIPAALLPLVFERFVQGEQALQRAAGGLGLGLAIARNLVELHGGSIRAQSAGPGLGSRFVVSLPALDSNALHASPPQPRPGDARQAVRILIVDDNVDAAESLAEVLRLEGHEVLTAGSAEEAIERLADFIPDAAFLDIGLPKMDGYELARTLRADPRLRATRLIALTGYGRAPDRRRAIDAGFDEHMVKPVDIESLLARLEELLSGSAALTT